MHARGWLGLNDFGLVDANSNSTVPSLSTSCAVAPVRDRGSTPGGRKCSNSAEFFAEDTGSYGLLYEYSFGSNSGGADGAIFFSLSMRNEEGRRCRVTLLRSIVNAITLRFARCTFWVQLRSFAILSAGKGTQTSPPSDNNGGLSNCLLSPARPCWPVRQFFFPPNKICSQTS